VLLCNNLQQWGLLHLPCFLNTILLKWPSYKEEVSQCSYFWTLRNVLWHALQDEVKFDFKRPEMVPLLQIQHRVLKVKNNHCRTIPPESECPMVDSYVPGGSHARICHNVLVHRNGYCHHTPHNAWNNLYLHLPLAALVAPRGSSDNFFPQTAALENYITHLSICWASVRFLRPFLETVFTRTIVTSF
jgi:hypothetical protein